MRPDSSVPCSLLALTTTLLRLGALAFGGLGPALALMQRELVEQRGWLTPADLRDALAFTKPLPGSTVVQVVAFLGWRLRGGLGALLATVAFLLPSFGLMALAAAGAAVLPDAAWVRGALTGIQVAVVGLLASALWKLARSEARGPTLSLVLAAACGLGFLVPAALVVVGAGALGAVLGPEQPADA